ncbi:unnamed protein product, partial [Didymodactylos carnosus]
TWSSGNGSINLLVIGGKDPAEYGRRVLKALFSEYDLATKLMPSPSGCKRSNRELLDPDKIVVLKSNN